IECGRCSGQNRDRLFHRERPSRAIDRCGHGRARGQIRARMDQSDEFISAWYSAGDTDLFEYRHATTNMFLSWCQSLRTTSHSNVSPELMAIVSTTPGLGMDSSSSFLLNRMSLLLMVSRLSVSSRRMRRDGIRRLISTVCGM